jgi:hypothetical protein
MMGTLNQSRKSIDNLIMEVALLGAVAAIAAAATASV